MNLTDDPWIAYQLDTAVSTVGLVIEGALQEMRNAGSDKEPRWEPRYTLRQLLDPEYRLPKEEEQGSGKGAVAALKALAGKGVKVFKAKG